MKKNAAVMLVCLMAAGLFASVVRAGEGEESGAQKTPQQSNGFAEYQALKQYEMAMVLSGKAQRQKRDAILNDLVVSTETIASLPVTGPPSFRAKVGEALHLLHSKANAEYQLVQQKISAVHVNPQSYVTAGNKKPVFYLNPRTASSSTTTWLAAAFVHEACHVEQRESRKPSKKGRSRFDQQKEMELECNGKQAQTLKKLGASAEEIRSLETAGGTHFDVNQDGRFTTTDRKLQNW